MPTALITRPTAKRRDLARWALQPLKRTQHAEGAGPILPHGFGGYQEWGRCGRTPPDPDLSLAAGGTGIAPAHRHAPTCERDELRDGLEARAQVPEESRGELRARAERAGRELDRVRGELATQRHGAGEEDTLCAPQQPGGGGTGIARNKEAPART